MMLGDAMTPFYPILGDAMTPFYPVLVVFLSKLNSNLPSVFVQITSFEAPVFDISHFPKKFLPRASYSHFTIDYFEQGGYFRAYSFQ